MLVDGLRWAALLGAAHLPSPVRTTEPEMREQTRREAPCVPGWRNQRPLDEALAELRRMHADECRESEARFFHGEATSSEHGSRQLTTWHRFAFARPAPAAEVCSSRSVARGGAPSDAEHAITTSGVIDAYPPVPFRMDDLACVSQTPLFTREECAAVIAEAEAANSWRGDGQNRTFSHLSDPIFRSYIPILYTAHLSAPCSPPLSHPTCPTCPTSPHISSHLPTSPHISPHLPTSPHISPHLRRQQTRELLQRRRLFNLPKGARPLGELPMARLQVRADAHAGHRLRIPLRRPQGPTPPRLRRVHCQI